MSLKTNAIQSFQFNSHTLRIVPDEKGDHWFIAKDVCDILDYGNAARSVNQLCRKDGILNMYIPTLSANYTLIDEGNLYRLIIKSTKPESEPFESWLCDEVLPTSRKTGSYFPNIKRPLSLAEFESRQTALKIAENELSKATISLTVAELMAIKSKHVSADEIISLAKQGLSRSEIVLATGKTSNHIRQIIFHAKKLGILECQDDTELNNQSTTDDEFFPEVES